MGGVLFSEDFCSNIGQGIKKGLFQCSRKRASVRTPKIGGTYSPRMKQKPLGGTTSKAHMSSRP
jgi:hypothetical protein